jgi:hypothetical protein
MFFQKSQKWSKITKIAQNLVIFGPVEKLDFQFHPPQKYSTLIISKLFLMFFTIFNDFCTFLHFHFSSFLRKYKFYKDAQ